MGGMLGIGGHIIHRRHNGRQDDVPILGGVLVEGHLDALEHVNLIGQRIERSLETQGRLTANFIAALQFKHYNMLGHLFKV